MEKVEYDLDTSGGLMEEIQALVAPPQSEDTTKKKLSSSKEPILPKRPFRAINRDSCDACSEGGDLLCCDQCPSSFHLQCCDPPLEDEDVPTGEWICNECKYGVKKRTDQKLFRLFRSTSRKEQPDTTTCVDNELGTRAFTKLVEMFRHKNPTEFQLPPDIQDYTVMPGQRRKQVNKDQPRKKEDEVQRLCFVCTKSQRIGDLINCDFCPLVFHRDCLMPPLGQEPLGLWMCPQHPENYEPRLRHTKYSQRSQVIEELRSNINHNAVKLEFFRRAKKERILMNRKFHQPNRRRTSVVPDVVKAQYINPPAQIVPDYTENLNKTLKPHMKPLSLPTSQEKDDWLRAVIDLQCSIADSLEKDDIVSPGVVGNNNSNVASPLLLSDKMQSQSTGKAKDDKSPQQKTFGNEKECKVPDIEKDEPFTKVNVKEKIIQPKETEEKQSANQQDPKEQSKETNIVVTTHDENRCVPISKSSPITTISKAGSVNSIFTSIMSPSSSDVTLKSSLRDSEMMMGNTEILKDPTLSQLDDRLVRVLAFQRLQQLMEKKKTRQIPKVSEPGISHKKTIVQITENKPGIAVFSPLNGTGNGCFMRNKSFNAGQGADMDLCLSNYGFCNYISGKHATVFYDRETRQFELLNYSEHGTIVDNVLYSCDFSEKTKSSSVTSANAKFDTSSKFQNAGQRLKRPPVGRTTKGLGTEFITKACNCRASASSLIGGSGAGWEGTAVLHHGSYIKFGCLHFIFSIVGCANNNNNNNGNNNNHNNNNNNNNNTPSILSTVNKKNTDGCKSMAKIAKLVPVVTPVHHGETVTSVT